MCTMSLVSPEQPVLCILLVGCTSQAPLDSQAFPCTYLAHHEPESVGRKRSNGNTGVTLVT